MKRQAYSAVPGTPAGITSLVIVAFKISMIPEFLHSVLSVVLRVILAKRVLRTARLVVNSKNLPKIMQSQISQIKDIRSDSSSSIIFNLAAEGSVDGLGYAAQLFIAECRQLFQKNRQLD
jgi:hypothetical protein